MLSRYLLFFGGDFFNLKMEADAGAISRGLGIIILATFIAYIMYLIFNARKNLVSEEENAKSIPLWKCLLYYCAWAFPHHCGW